MKKRILVAALHWGLGHATRCIPLINALKINGFEPIIGSDGMALKLLQQEFPDLQCVELPSYPIAYSKSRYTFKLNLLKAAPKFLKTIKSERLITAEIVKRHNISGIISDNRFGVHCEHVYSIFMTHQLNVLSGSTSWISTRMHRYIINKFNECWVPDVNTQPNLSGVLGHGNTLDIPIKYIGALSRFKKRNHPITYDIMILLSGPEPQRGILEQRLLKEFKVSEKKIIFVKGVIEDQSTKIENGNMHIYNYLLGQELEDAINSSALVIARSGYTTIMDLATLEKLAYFIPTPGQYEQEYLAKKLTIDRLVPSCKQEDFTAEKLKDIDTFSGLNSIELDTNFKQLFSVFRA